MPKIEVNTIPTYNQKLLEHFRNPQNIGTIEQPHGYARVQNPVNGFTTDIYLRIENERIADIKFKTYGCTVTIAAASALTKIVKGKHLKEIIHKDQSIHQLEVLLREELGDIPEKNWHCLPTALQTFYTAIREYYTKKNNNTMVKQIDEILSNIQVSIEKKLLT
ncbi:MAG: iron-sulfur cluster assembly scaffold protein [Candidatus Thermoplasmatota archaeon]|nr:iron-sulfur cluster assembly scaffold protein [Candidatus Thermoplasmatota archaeon]MBU1941913.1 iron-sulfur cluster assembly scaffold protein [Candidatus Thermoplasmatota archaeon]